jgi:hypothetical protein
MTGGIFMNTFKKNMIAAAILLVVCAGIYMNWSYTNADSTKDLTDTLDAQKVMSNDTLRLEGESLGRFGAAAEAFLSAQLERGFRTLDFYKSLDG